MLATGVICAAQFILQLDFSIVNVALPTIQRELGMAPAELQWIVTGYALAAAAPGGQPPGDPPHGGLSQPPIPPARGRLAGLRPGAVAGHADRGTDGAGRRGRARLASVGALAAATVLAAAFIYSERTVASPMIPPSFLSDRARRAAVAAMLLIGAVLAGYVYFISLYLQKVHGFTPVETGLALVPSTGTVVLTSTFGTRRLLARFSVRQVLVAGLAFMTAGQLWLAQADAGSSYAAGVLPGLILTALGVGMSLPAASVAITSGVRGRDQGIAGAMFTTGQQTGAAVGLAILATAAAARTAHTGDLVAGYQLAFLIGACLAASAIVVVATRVLGPRAAGPAGAVTSKPAGTSSRPDAP